LAKFSVGEGLAAFLIVLALAVGISLFVIWLIWLIWTAVMPALWPNGPAQFIDPGYWLFVGMWVILAAIGGLFKGAAGKS
jgi:hypothetical protein